MPVPVDDLPSNLVPASDLPDLSAPKPKVGGLESFGRGAAQAFGLGYSPQIIAAIKSGHMLGSSEPEYVKELAKQKEATNQAWEQHPWLYGSGMVASAIPAAVTSVVAAPEEAAGLGAAGLLSESSNLGSLAGRALGAAGGEGLAAKGAQAAGSALSNPIVQGAIYGSSEGENLSDKLSGAAAGAIGAKVAPMVLGAAGKAISGFAPKSVSAALSGSHVAPNDAADIASKLGVSLPAGALSDSKLMHGTAALDAFSQMPRAAKKTVDQIGAKIKETAGDANPADTGAGLRDAISHWAFADAGELPTGYKALQNSYYAPLGEVNRNGRFGLNNLRAAVEEAYNSPAGTMGNLDPTLSVAYKALQRGDDLTLPELRQLRENISDHMRFGSTEAGVPTNQRVLSALRSAVTNDMRAGALNYGGKDLLNAFNEADKNAAELFRLKDSMFNIAHPNASPNTVYQKVINGLSSAGKGPDRADVAKMKDVINSVDPSLWQNVQHTYANQIAPNGQFSFKNLNKMYGNALHPEGKSILFDNTPGSIGETIDLAHQLGSKGDLGSKLDAMSSKSGSHSLSANPLTYEIPLGLLESSLLGGVPLKTLSLGAAGSAAGALGSRNVAKAASQYQPSLGTKIAQQAINKASPTLGAQTVAPNLGPALKGATIMKGVNTINSIPPEYLGYLGLGAHLLTRAHGGRSNYATGGKIGGRNPKSDAMKLIDLADKIKKNEAATTSSLLNLDDTTIAKALAVANRSI